MGLIKDIYSPAFYNKFGGSLGKILSSFDQQKFMNLVMDNDFDHKEWKDRMKHTTVVLHEFLPNKFPSAVKTISRLIDQLRKDNAGDDNLAYIFLADYVEQYGLDHFTESIHAFEKITQFISCEFAVRPFIVKYGDAMMKQMLKWSTHKAYQVRRLSSEGSRPRLPWAMAIPALKKDPTSIIPILENLKADESDIVRRSVANNLNDISKDNPELVITLCSKWMGVSKETDALAKHALRTLLKQGNLSVLNSYGMLSENFKLQDFEIQNPVVKIGDALEFIFSVKNEDIKQRPLRIEYAIYYRKSRGHLAKKVFKISERNVAPMEELTFKRKQSFKLITTRKFHAGAHQVAIILNGLESKTKDFTLTE